MESFFSTKISYPLCNTFVESNLEHITMLSLGTTWMRFVLLQIRGKLGCALYYSGNDVKYKIQAQASCHMMCDNQQDKSFTPVRYFQHAHFLPIVGAKKRRIH